MFNALQRLLKRKWALKNRSSETFISVGVLAVNNGNSNYMHKRNESASYAYLYIEPLLFAAKHWGKRPFVLQVLSRSPDSNFVDYFTIFMYDYPVLVISLPKTNRPNLKRKVDR
jgi:hypothetical protein